MRFERAQPKSGTGDEGAGLVEAEKDGEPEEKKDGGLAEVDAEERRGKAVAEPRQMTARGAEELPQDSDGGDEETEHGKRPGKSGGDRG